MNIAAVLKPLGGKAYGSIPHLSGSRMGPADHHCHAGQEAICLTKTRDRHDIVIVTEKLDGSNVAVALHNGKILPLTRSGYHAATSPYMQHAVFASWVGQNEGRFREVLQEGERINAEWMWQAHGTRYELPHEPFVVFDMMVGKYRRPWIEVCDRLGGKFIGARLLHCGGALSLDEAIAAIETSGHGAIDPVEGAVWRVERRGVFDFMAKWVRPTKVDGCYLPSITGQPEVLNIYPGCGDR